MNKALKSDLKAAIGKTAADEDFPVASLFLPPPIRAQVLDFYALARRADDIADDPALLPAERLARLDLMERGLGQDLASDHLRPLIEAFRRDAVNQQCHGWDDLMAYCRLSAMPVGRYLLALHGEEHPAALKASDELCAALQILNHLKDCGRDYRLLGRVYIPLEWLEDAALSLDALAAPATKPQLRRLFDRVLTAVDDLLVHATPLTRHLKDRRLRLQASSALAMAHALAHKLRHRDPLAGTVGLSTLDKARCLLLGVVTGWNGR